MEQLQVIGLQYYIYTWRVNIMLKWDYTPVNQKPVASGVFYPWPNHYINILSVYRAK